MFVRSYTSTSPADYVARLNGYPFVTVRRSLQKTLNDILSDVPSTKEKMLPVRLDVHEDETAFHVTTDLPGLNEGEVEVTFDDGLLTIHGEKKIARDEKKDTWHVAERSQGTFARQLTLPATIAADKIEAKFEKGVLNVTLPKLPAAQTAAKKITIKAG